MPHGRVRVLQEAIGEGVACEDLTFCRCQDCGKTDYQGQQLWSGASLSL